MQLYSTLAGVYEAMYTTFINYEEEYTFYSNILSRYKSKNLLEIGSGTGNLARLFEENGYHYQGLDLSSEMIAIAKNKSPESTFTEGDMRDFKLNDLVDSVIITGRTISYLLSNEDVNSTFKSIAKNLKKGGILSFDFIDANRFIPEISPNKKIIHEAMYKDVQYVRESKWEVNLKNGMDFTWHSIYNKQEGNNLIKIAEDTSTVRTFTRDEIEILLGLNNFKVKEFIDKAAYAFPTYVVVAERC